MACCRVSHRNHGALPPLSRDQRGPRAAGSIRRLCRLRAPSALEVASRDLVIASRALDASAVEPASGTASSGGSRTVKFPTRAVVPALGQGSAGLGQGRHPAAEEEEALRTGLSLGMTLIDTSGD